MVSVQNDSIVISDLKVKPEDVNGILLEKGFHVSELAILQPNLEEFFMKLVSDARPGQFYTILSRR